MTAYHDGRSSGPFSYQHQTLQTGNAFSYWGAYDCRYPFTGEQRALVLIKGKACQENEIQDIMSFTTSPSPPPPSPSPPPTSPSPAAAYTFTTKDSLQTAVQAYNANPTDAIATYGLIANWDVSAITDMNWLFYNLKNFNADISNWATSKVPNMAGMFNVRSARALPPQP